VPEYTANTGTYGIKLQLKRVKVRY